MKIEENPRKMVYNLYINDYPDEESVIQVVKTILDINKTNVLGNSRGSYQVEFPKMVLIIQGCDEGNDDDLLETPDFQ